mgnify:FL=1
MTIAYYRLDMDMCDTIKSMPDRLEELEKRMCQGIWILSNGKVAKINHSKNINIKKENKNGFVLVACIGSKRDYLPFLRQFDDIVTLYKKLISYGLHIKDDGFKVNNDFLEMVYRCFFDEFTCSKAACEFVFCIDYFIPRYTGRTRDIFHRELKKNIRYFEFQCPELLLYRLTGTYKHYYDYENGKSNAYISSEFDKILHSSSFGFDDLMDKKECTYLSILESQIKGQ